MKDQQINKSKRLNIGQADLHMHSNYSDGAASVRAILDHVQKNTELDVIAITDHDTIEGARLAAQIARRRHYRFELIIGQEITTRDGEIIGLFLKKSITPKQTFEESVADVLAQGGLVIIPHPNLFHYHIHPNRILHFLSRQPRAIAGIELSSFIVFDPKDAKKWQMITKKYKIAPVAGSDSHELFTIGRARTLFAGATARDLRRALISGKTDTVYMHLARHERLSFFVYAIKVNIGRRLHLNGYNINQFIPQLSPKHLVIRTAKHIFRLPY